MNEKDQVIIDKDNDMRQPTRTSEVKEDFLDWLHYYAPNVPKSVLPTYLQIFETNDIFTPQQMVELLYEKPTSWLEKKGFRFKDREKLIPLRFVDLEPFDNLATQADHHYGFYWLVDQGVHEFDALDIISLSMRYGENKKKVPAIPSEYKKEGDQLSIKEYLLNIPGIEDEVANLYANRLKKEHVITMDRFRQLSKDYILLKQFITKEGDALKVMWFDETQRGTSGFGHSRFRYQRYRHEDEGPDEKTLKTRQFVEEFIFMATSSHISHETVEDYLHEHPYIVTYKDEYGWRPHHYFAYYRGLSAVESQPTEDIEEGHSLLFSRSSVPRKFDTPTTSTSCMCWSLTKYTISHCNCWSVFCLPPPPVWPKSVRERELQLRTVCCAVPPISLDIIHRSLYAFCCCTCLSACLLPTVFPCCPKSMKKANDQCARYLVCKGLIPACLFGLIPLSHYSLCCPCLFGLWSNGGKVITTGNSQCSDLIDCDKPIFEGGNRFAECACCPCLYCHWICCQYPIQCQWQFCCIPAGKEANEMNLALFSSGTHRDE